MKIKALLAALVGAVAIQGATAGTSWCPPAPCNSGKGCAVDCCPDIGGQVSVGYDTDYVWRGVRWARDSVWADVNYTFDNLPFSPNIGVWHLSSLGSAAGGPRTAFGPGNDAYGDETNIYAGIDLPSILGFDTGLGYVLNLFPTSRGPSGTPFNGGDSFQRVQFNASRELFCGLHFNYLAEYFFGNTGNGINGSDLDGWFHTLGLAKSFCVTDCISLDLSAETGYNDGLWSGLGAIGNAGPGRLGGYGSGFNHYLLKAALPIALNCRATLTPYVAYNGTPDAWVADGLSGISVLTNNQGANANDGFFGGVSVTVDF